MGCLISVIRAGAALVLGVVIFVGFLFFLILNNFSDKLLSADFYKDTIVAEDTYNRIYEEVLLDEALLDTTQELLGDIQIVTQQEIVDLMREIMPPAYIQEQGKFSCGRGGVGADSGPSRTRSPSKAFSCVVGSMPMPTS